MPPSSANSMEATYAAAKTTWTEAPAASTKWPPSTKASAPAARATTPSPPPPVSGARTTIATTATTPYSNSTSTTTSPWPTSCRPPWAVPPTPSSSPTPAVAPHSTGTSATAPPPTNANPNTPSTSTEYTPSASSPPSTTAANRPTPSNTVSDNSVANPFVYEDGTYILRITSNQGCYETDTFSVISVYLVDTVIVNNPTCPGSNNGSIKVVLYPNVRDSAHYYWDGVEGDSVLSNLSADGTHHTLVVESHGCRHEHASIWLGFAQLTERPEDLCQRLDTPHLWSPRRLAHRHPHPKPLPRHLHHQPPRPRRLPL